MEGRKGGTISEGGANKAIRILWMENRGRATLASLFNHAMVFFTARFIRGL